jgi:hypothetical protein
MKSLHKLALSAALAAFFIVPALAQNPGTVTNHAFVIGGGANTTGYTSLLCTSAQLAVGQTAADPICRTLTGDVTIDAAGVTAIGSAKVTNAMLNADVYSTIHTWSAAQTVAINQNTTTAWIASNNSAGTAAAAGFVAGNGTNNGTFGIGGTGNTAFSSALQNRAYVLSNSTAAGIAVFSDGANPINFYNNGTLSGAFSGAGVFSLTTPLAASSGGTGLSSLAAGCATFLGTATSANLRGCISDETGTGLAYFQGGDIGTPSAGSAANLTLAANQVTRANLAQGVARSVVGVAGNSTANVADIQGSTANTFLGVNSAGTGVAFQSLRQIIPFYLNTVSIPQATTLFTITLGNATEAAIQALCPIAGTFRNLFIQTTAPAAGQTLTAVWRVNNADTALTCVVTGTGTTCNDTTHTATCTAGQSYAVKLTTSATTGTLTSVSGGVEFDTP